MKRKSKIVVFFLAVIIAYFFGRLEGMQKRNNLTKLKLSQAEVWVEIADETQEWQQGLSGREKLAEDQGMLFIYPQETRLNFWMKEMKIPLDMIIIRNGRVSEIYQDIPAPDEGEDGRQIKVASKGLAQMLLEVNAGWAKRQEVRVGDQVELVKR